MDLSELNELKQDAVNGNFGLNDFPNNSKTTANAPPPIPQRSNPPLTNAINPMFNSYSQPGGYGSFGTGYGSMYNSTMYGGGGGYHTSPFGGASAGGYGIGNTNSFMRSAEESSRGAFQSIESVVQAFSAVSAMFESTYYAVYNSFRAVVGVADQFYRLKTHLSGILSAFALVRMLRFLYRKCLHLLGIRKQDGSRDQIWSNVAKNLSDAEIFVKENRKKHTNWPLIMFLAVVLGGPWLIWRVLSSIESIGKDDNLWMSGKIDHFVAVSEFDFDSVNTDELSFRRGQRIIIAPKEYQPKLRGWLLGSIDGKTMGIMPANYLKILGKKLGENQQESQPETN